MKYIDYSNMKEFYTINELCRLFELDKKTLKQFAEKFDIQPQEDQYGNWGFRKILVRRLHNCIYKEQRENNQDASYYNNRKADDPWA